VRPLGGGLHEVRINLPDGIARVVFTVDDGIMILLHGFIKKSRKMPQSDLKLARSRLRAYLTARHESEKQP